MKSPIVIKIGGAILEQADALVNLLDVVKQLQEDGNSVILVHGGGCLVDEMLAKAGFSSEKKQGLRVTPQEQMPLVAGVLAGSVNKHIVATANSINLPSVGLSLSDGEMISCQLSALNLGMVGEPKAKNNSLLNNLLDGKFLPVISSIGALDDGQLVNVNADDAAVAISELVNGELILLTDVKGVKGADGQYLPTLSSMQAKKLISDGVIAGGMIAKVNAALAAAKNLRRSIAVASWQSPQDLLSLVSANSVNSIEITNSSGTRILAN